MPNDLRHEQHRWSYMTPEQLLRRLGKIKDPVKLRNFAACAHNYENDQLFIAAYRRAVELGYRLGMPFDRQAQQLVRELNGVPMQTEQAWPGPPPELEARKRQKRQLKIDKVKKPRVRLLKGLES